MATGAACDPHSERASRIYAQPYRGRTFLHNFLAPQLLHRHCMRKTIRCRKKMLYCYAYLWISERGVYNLHVSDHRGILKLRDFLGDNHLRIDFDRNPNLIFFGEEIISPYLTQRDYNDFVQSLQKAGFDWKIERGEENMLDSYKYMLKETRTK